jgi:hypothetical protein
MDILTIIILVIILAVVIQVCSEDAIDWFFWMCGCDSDKSQSVTDDEEENFNGALQSLYSNDGIQDIHLTVNNDNTGWGGWGNNWGGSRGGYGWGYDPYRYWRGIPWNLPTRNLSRVTYYPYLYEYYLDRYGRFYPYW